MRGRLFLLLLLAFDAFSHSVETREVFFQDVVRQRSLGNNGIDQCPCVMHPESRQCIAYDSRYQAATLEEAILTFPDLTHDSYFPAPVSSATFLCQSVECQHCFGLLFYRLQDVGFLSPSYRPHITLLPRNQLNPRNCPRLRFPLPPPIVPPEPPKSDYVKKLIDAGFRFMQSGGLPPPRQFSNRDRFRPGPQNSPPVVPGGTKGGQSSHPAASQMTQRPQNGGNSPGAPPRQTTEKPNNHQKTTENHPPVQSTQRPQKLQNNQQTNQPRGPNQPQHPPPAQGQNQQHRQQPSPQVRRPWRPQTMRPQGPRQQPTSQSVWNPQTRRWELRDQQQVLPQQSGQQWTQVQQPRWSQQSGSNQWEQQQQQLPQVQQQQFPQVQQIPLQPVQQWQPQLQAQAQTPEWQSPQFQQWQFPQQQQQQFTQPAIAQSIAQQAVAQSQISNPAIQQISVPFQGGGQNGQGQGQSGPPTSFLGSIVGNLLGGLRILGRKKRAADDPLVGRRFTIACIRRGEASSEDGEFLSLCGSCWTWRELPEDYFPRILNEFSCQENDYCLSGWGTCKQQLRNVDVLRRVDGRWVPQSVTTATCCDCRVKAGTEIHALVVGDRRKTE